VIAELAESDSRPSPAAVLAAERQDSQERHLAAVRREGRDLLEEIIKRVEKAAKDAERLLHKAEEANEFGAAVAAVRECRAAADSLTKVFHEAVEARRDVTGSSRLSEPESIRLASNFLRRRGWTVFEPGAVIEAKP
jgi:hypothetical protein